MDSVLLNILGIIAGAGMTIAAMFVAPDFETTFDTLFGISGSLFWIWMLWTGVLLWMRTPKHTDAAEAPVDARSL